MLLLGKGKLSACIGCPKLLFILCMFIKSLQNYQIHNVMWVQSAYSVVVTIASIDVLFWDRRWNVATNNINRYSSNYPRFMYYFVFLWSSSHFMVWAFSAVNASNIDGHSFQFAWCFLLVGVRGSSRARSQNVIWEKRGRNNNYNNNNEEDIMMTADIWRLLLRFYGKGAGFHRILRTTPDLPLKWVNVCSLQDLPFWYLKPHSWGPWWGWSGY